MSTVLEFGLGHPVFDIELQDMLGRHLDRTKALAELIQAYSPDNIDIKTIRNAGSMLLMECQDAEQAFKNWAEGRKEAQS